MPEEQLKPELTGWQWCVQGVCPCHDSGLPMKPVGTLILPPKRLCDSVPHGGSHPLCGQECYRLVLS